MVRGISGIQGECQDDVQTLGGTAFFSDCGESGEILSLASVRVHETETGYAETEGWEPLVAELDSMPLRSVIFSDEIIADTGMGRIVSVLSSENGRFGCPE